MQELRQVASGRLHDAFGNQHACHRRQRMQTSVLGHECEFSFVQRVASQADTQGSATLRFGIGRTTYNLPLIAIGAGALLLVANFLKGRARERDQRIRSINLVQVKTDEEDGAEEAGDAGSTSSTPPKRTDVP